MPIGYVTVAEADAYVATRYTTTSDIRTGWEALSTEDKEIRLQGSVDVLDQLPFHGRKTLSTQLNAFPRHPYPAVPSPIKYAQIENALKPSDADMESYERMQLLGVKSYTLDGLSESFGNSGVQYHGISSATAMRLLKPYLGGGYSIR